MGHMQASEFASSVEDGVIDLEQALRWHLQSNHYPPVTLAMLEPCKAAIEACDREDWDELIDLPDGVTYRDANAAPAIQIVEAHHLHEFLGLGVKGVQTGE